LLWLLWRSCFLFSRSGDALSGFYAKTAPTLGASLIRSHSNTRLLQARVGNGFTKITNLAIAGSIVRQFWYCLTLGWISGTRGQGGLAGGGPDRAGSKTYPQGWLLFGTPSAVVFAFVGAPGQSLCGREAINAPARLTPAKTWPICLRVTRFDILRLCRAASDWSLRPD